MPATFVRLRIVGFKSFAEPALVELLPGLTGIVGPNGCGKSNVVEALRWAMGESSARSLRGGEMDDVIFAGTAGRPRRDIAEVTLSLADTEGLAPPFHREPELQVSRRIQRESGSVYRVNGREARARDVQTLFADLATGARASAMVSQGRVAAVVAATPVERRGILEEAAGITGLHTRRQEAELKLRAAEANLERADDLRGQLESQLESLQRQARQAARLRSLGDSIRDAERDLLAIQQAASAAALREAESGLAAAEAGMLAEATSAPTTQTAAVDAAAALPELRSHEAACRTARERARIEADQANAEAAEASRTAELARQRAAQVARDLAHAQSLHRDAIAATDRVADEARRLAAADKAHPGLLADAEAAAAAAAVAEAEAEAVAEAATERSAELLARHRTATDAQGAAASRAGQIASRAARLAEDALRARGQLVAEDQLRDAETARDLALAGRRSATAAAERAEAARAQAQAATASARAAASSAQATRARLAAAAQGVAEALDANFGGGGRRMVDELVVPPGLELALAAALGADLEAGIEPDQPRHWRELPPLQTVALPAAATPLADQVGAPAALRRALAQVGLVETGSAELQEQLRPGQTLVSREGAAWRWDGLTVQAGTLTSAAVRLQQRNRLAGLRAELADAERLAGRAASACDAAEQSERARHAGEQAARAARRAADQEVERRHREHQSLAVRHEAATARLATLDEQATQVAAEQAETAQALAAAQATLEDLGDPAEARAASERTRAARAAARSQEAAAAGQLEAIRRDAAARQQREASLAAEREDWATRAIAAAARVDELAARWAEADAELARQQAAPAQAALRRVAAQQAQTAAEASHRSTEAALAAGEAAAAAADRAAREAAAALAAARETTLRAEAAATAARHAWATVTERVIERLGAAATLPEPAAFAPADEERARRRLDRLQRERDAMGPVNQRAELEAAAIAEQVATIGRETAELTAAVAKLRGSIGHIDREGRGRLGQVFADIDRHFRALFEQMFGGGKAHLALVGSDDPLLAGLEIYAQPPGKKLASLSLLSGGEQALAALSLIFAVFRCQPAPICVLDEVDAPLDDANVARFCDLLDAMARETGTRFLVVTHHQLTMARMDRLYGVTMQERGVSRLLSVDLNRAAELVEQDRMAAE